MAGEMTSEKVTIREHKIPSADSKPYIAVEGPEGALWFCESGASKIGRLDPDRGTFTEFALPTKNATPIGIALGGDGNLWFAEKAADKIGRLTPRGDIAEFALSAGVGADGMILGPDGNIWFSESDANRIAKITPDGRITEYGDGISPGAKPLSIAVRDGALWFSEASGNRIGRITVDGAVTEFPIPSHDSQPRAMVTHPDGSIWFVETSTNALGRIDRQGRITEHPVPTPNASLRGVTVGAGGDLWYTANFANKIGCMAPDGTVRGEYDIPTPNSGARCIAALPTAGCSSPNTTPVRSARLCCADTSGWRVTRRASNELKLFTASLKNKFGRKRHEKIVASRRLPAGGFARRRPRPDLSQPPDQVDRADLGRLGYRRRGAAHRVRAAAAAWPAGRRDRQAGRRHGAGRHRMRQIAAGRLHALRGRTRHHVVQPADRPQSALRSGQGFHAGDRHVSTSWKD